MCISLNNIYYLYFISHNSLKNHKQELLRYSKRKKVIGKKKKKNWRTKNCREINGKSTEFYILKLNFVSRHWHELYTSCLVTTATTNHFMLPMSKPSFFFKFLVEFLFFIILILLWQSETSATNYKNKKVSANNKMRNLLNWVCCCSNAISPALSE